MEQTSRNDSEPHLMSPETPKSGDQPSPSALGEGRREQAGKQSALAQNSGGVRVDSASGSKVRVSWEGSGGGKQESQGPVQAGCASKAGPVAGEVGVPHSTVDLHYFKRCKEGRGDTYSVRRGEAKDTGMAQATEIITPDQVRELQIALYRKAKAQPKYRFWSLYGELLRLDVLESALDAQIRNDGGAGVDGESLAGVKSKRRGWLEQLREELRTKSYRPSPVLRVMIPKRSGGQRPLGIPTVKDRVVQTALYMVLMPIWEADFDPRSYGFRPKRRAHQAIDGICQAVNQGYTEIIDADLSNYFGTIPHRALMKMVARRVSDGSVLKLINSWLRAPIVEEDKDGKRRVSPNRCGTPQGGVISPLLANIYLNPLDHGVNEKCVGQARMFRYADDVVIACRPGRGGAVRERTERWLEAKGLKLNESKTRVVDIREEGINFLGFNLTWRQSHRGRKYLHVEPSQGSRMALRDNLRGIMNHWTLWRPIAEVVQETNRVLRGWSGYFHFRNSTAVMSNLQRYSRDRLRRWLWRKHACKGGLWTRYPNERLHAHYELYALPTTAAWKAAR
jgi:RNA-directed DNA polymerase